MADLTQQQFRELFSYDKDSGMLRWMPKKDGDLSSARSVSSWNTKYAGRLAGSKGAAGYLRVNVQGKKHFVHRVVWVMANGEIPTNMQIDHINHIRDDNRLQNLRLVTHQENNKNISLPRKSTGPTIGVIKNKRTGSWVAQIKVDGKKIHLATTKDMNEAIRIRAEANKKFGFHENHGANPPMIPAVNK